MSGIMSGSYARDQADNYLQQIQAFGIDADQETIDFIAPPSDTTMGSLGYTPYAGTISYKGAKQPLTPSEARSTFVANLNQARAAALAGSYPRAAQLIQTATDALHLNGVQLRGDDRIALNKVKALFPPKMQNQLGLSGMGDLGLGIPGIGSGGSLINVILLGLGIGFGIHLMNRG